MLVLAGIIVVAGGGGGGAQREVSMQDVGVKVQHSLREFHHHPQHEAEVVEAEHLSGSTRLPPR